MGPRADEICRKGIGGPGVQQRAEVPVFESLDVGATCPCGAHTFPKRLSCMSGKLSQKQTTSPGPTSVEWNFVN